MLIPVHKLSHSELLQFAFDLAKHEQEKGTPFPHGACTVLCSIEAKTYQVKFSEVKAIMNKFVEWPGSSGDITYPVPGVLGVCDPAFSYTRFRGSSWDPSHPCGKLRHEMIEWTINKLKEEECSMQA
jgi:hypothetical protein